ncbi:MAG TPA: hypothetical protein VMJ66_06195 [Geobacteraceae bacterium]|nr:hypothetical protein [Geobacteraceae bacterium]
MLKEFFSHNFAKVREINRKYAKPSVEMSPWVKGSLLFLRVYLVFLVGLLIYKFITLL